MDKLISKIELKLQELGVIQKEVVVETKLAEEDVESGTTEVTLVDAEIVQDPIKVTYTIVGEPVFVVTEGDEEVKVEDGTYVLSDGNSIVIAEGNLTEINEAEVVAEEETIETKEDVKLASVEKNRISDIVDLSKDGEYTIELSVYGGEITWGALYTSTWENLLMSKEEKTTAKVDELTLAFETKLSDEIAKYESIIEALKTGETKVELSDTDNKELKMSKTDIFKIQLAEKRKLKNNK